MSIGEAIRVFTTEEHGFIPIGYWVKDDGYIFMTKPIRAYRKMLAPVHYVVKNDGTVYGTNPMLDDLNPTTMKKLRYIERWLLSNFYLSK